jgi:hypothetical protein
MNRLATLAAGVALLLSTGCKNDGEWSVRKTLGWDEPARGSMPVLPKDVPTASLATCQRVEELSRKIIAQNTFCGLNPDQTLVSTIGVKESVLFHRGTDQLIISEGLVEKCQTDAELAAILCAEFGQMIAEKRTAKVLGRDIEPIPDIQPGGPGAFPGGATVDVGQQANLAYHEKKYLRGASSVDPVDAKSTACDLLKGAGYSPAELDRVDSLLKQKQSDRGEKIRKQMGGSAPEPVWQK